MRKITLNRWLILSIIALLLVVACAVIVFVIQKRQATYPINRVVQYSFSIQNTDSALLRDVDFSVYAPVKQTATQYLKELNASHPYTLEQDELNNQIMRFRFSEIAPFETRVVRIRAEVALSDKPNWVKGIKEDDFLGSDKYMETDDPIIQNKAAELKDRNSSVTARKTFDWVSQTIDYQGYIEEDRGALYAINNGLGDCTEYMYLLNALLRANDIPARSVGGYVTSQDSTLTARDYHNWSEVYLNGRWHIADPQNKSYMENQASFIAMRIIEKSSLALLNNSHRFAYSNANIKVTMN